MSLISKFKSLKKKVYYWYLSTHNPRKLAEHLYIDATGKKEGINWEHPRDLNEKINWLKFNTDTTKWSELADKYAVRSFVEEKGFGRYLVPLLGVWSNADQIDFSKLPNSFVLKTNNGAGTVMVVEDKSIIDETQVRTLLNKWLKKQFGLKQAEPHYLKIKPLIIAEAMLKEKSLISSSLIDYKIWCFGGKAFGTFVCYDRYRFAKKVECCSLELYWSHKIEKEDSKTVVTVVALSNDLKSSTTAKVTIPQTNAIHPSMVVPVAADEVYSIDGKRVNETQTGRIYIKKGKNGTAKKVIRR